jgi:dTDP-4-dehydrorhamnose 3,5-epimerase
VVDLRRSSPHFGQYASFELSAESSLLAWIPPGYAHGFYVISEQADVFYSVTDYRFIEHERTLLWNDRQLAIPWPHGVEPPILSDKDRAGVPFSETDYYP